MTQGASEAMVRDDLISRRAVWKALRHMHGIREGVGILKIVGRGEGEMVDRDQVEYMLEELGPVSSEAPTLLAERDRLREEKRELVEAIKGISACLQDRKVIRHQDGIDEIIYQLNATLSKAEKEEK